LAGLTPHVASHQQPTWIPPFLTESRVLILTPVRQTRTTFYAEKLFSFWRRHFLQNSLFGFRQLPQLRKSAMVDLEGPPPHSAAASHHKVSRHHCGQVGCCFCSGLWFVCFVCFVLVSSSSSLFTFQQFRLTCSFFLSFVLSFCHSISCWLLLVPSIFGGSLVLGFSSVPVPRLWPWRCSHFSASALPSVLAFPWCCFWCCYRRLSTSVLGPQLGAPPGILGLALLRVSLPLPRLSARNRPPCLGVPPRLLGLTLVLLLGSLASSAVLLLWLIVGSSPRRWCSSAPVPFLLGGASVLRTKPRRATFRLALVFLLGSLTSPWCSFLAP
jgi:hypothetical protein